MAEYVHKTSNQLTFDKLRQIQYEIELLKAYIAKGQGGNDVSDIISALDEASYLIYEKAYTPLRQIWL